MGSDDAPSAIGRYEIVGRLALGGMAEILLARLTGPSGFERPVVIKRILPSLAEEQSFVDMFLDEARIAARINHPNVVQHQELGREGDQLYLVMEYLEGETVASLQRRARSRRWEIGLDQAAFIVAEAAAGLHAAHEMTDLDGRSLGIVHRDISPQNLFVTYEGGVKVMDFGIAKAADRITVTDAGAIKGKFAYMSPEQARGDAIDRRSDIFSLGVVLYELTTGRTLFRRATRAATLRAVTEVDVVPPSRVVPGYPAELEAIVLRALAASPSDRYPDADALRRDLLMTLRRSDASPLPEHALRETMRALFEDRIAQKREMLRRVSLGDSLSGLPAGEVDRHVELPSIEVVVDVAEGAPAEAPSPRSGGRRLAALLGVGVLLGAATIAGVALLGNRAPEAPAPAVAEAPSPAVVAAAAPEPPSADAGAPTVTVRVETEPAGATVLVEGAPRGTTPTTISLPRGTAPVAVRLELRGHEPLELEVVPRADQWVRFPLRRARRPRRAPPAAAPAPEPPAPEAPTFPRFN